MTLAAGRKPGRILARRARTMPLSFGDNNL